MSARRFPIATLVAGGLLAGGVAAAGALTASGALAAGSTPSPAPSYSARRTPGGPGPHGFGGRAGHGFGRPGMGLGGRMLHGEVVVQKPGGGTETLLVQSGAITATSATSVTVRSSDGFTVVWSLSSSTTIRAGRNSGSVKDLAKDNTVQVVGTKSGSGGTARFVGERPKGAPTGPAGVPGGPRSGPFGGRGGPSGSSPPSASGAAFDNA
jgi:hypothetical protein